LETKYVSLAITQKRITVIEESNQIVAANYVFFKTLEKQTVIEVIATAREFLGKGYATKLLIDSLFLLGDLYPDHSFCSKIKSDNHASVRTHQKAGFIEVSDETERNRTQAYIRSGVKKDIFRPEDNVGHEKTKRLSRIIQTYLMGKYVSDETPWQFDVATVLMDTEKRVARVNLLEDIILERSR